MEKTKSNTITKVFQWILVCLSIIILLLAIVLKSILGIFIIVLSIVIIIPIFDKVLNNALTSWLNKSNSKLPPNIIRFVYSLLFLLVGLLISATMDQNKTDGTKHTQTTINDNNQQINLEKDNLNQEKGKTLFVAAFNGKSFYMSKDEDNFKFCWLKKTICKNDSSVKWILVDNSKIDHIWTKWEALGDRRTMYEFKKYINEYTIEVLHTYPNNFKSIEKWYFKKPDITECTIE